ncbi:MAG: class I SAM-dependent methyltransferase [Candidatus Latescibacterota bacterium]|nr:class I SAM-dependent methyltransferase [Candidatus Latescibacterota bacterium]
MSELRASTEVSAPQRLASYKEHYRTDASLIRDPEALDPVRSSSEARRLEVIARRLAPLRGLRLLDMGCGSGWFADLCHRRGARVVACDIAPTGVAAARRRFPDAGAFAAGDIYDLGFASASFDAVVLSEVVEHLERPQAGVKEAVRLLCPGGRLAITVPYRESIVEHLCVHCNRLTPANAHLHCFDEERLDEAIEGAGLRVRARLKMTNKLLELSGFPQASRHWPFWLWRACDRLCSQVVRRPAFLLVIAEKSAQ